jgi:hypothetical protein
MYRSLPQAPLIVIYFVFFNRDLSALFLSLAQVVQHLSAVKKQQIGTCKKMSQDTKLKTQSLISESAAATTSTKKRASGDGLVTKGLVSAAVAEALSKRPRPSASTGVRSF